MSWSNCHLRLLSCMMSAGAISGAILETLPTNVTKVCSFQVSGNSLTNGFCLQKFSEVRGVWGNSQIFSNIDLRWCKNMQHGLCGCLEPQSLMNLLWIHVIATSPGAWHLHPYPNSHRRCQRIPRRRIRIIPGERAGILAGVQQNERFGLAIQQMKHASHSVRSGCYQKEVDKILSNAEC